MGVTRANAPVFSHDSIMQCLSQVAIIYKIIMTEIGGIQAISGWSTLYTRPLVFCLGRVQSLF